MVKIEVLPDDTYDPNDFDDNAEDRKAYERDGAWGLVSYAQDESGNWVHADSCWGFVGYRDVLSPIENAYVPDLMQAALNAIPDPAAMI